MSTVTAALISSASAVIVGVLSLIGVISTNRRTSSALMNELRTAQAVTDTKIEALAAEVREHNNFAHRVPVLEEQIRSVQHRIKCLEQKGGER